mgnify:CR=1 FL=1
MIENLKKRIAAIDAELGRLPDAGFNFTMMEHRRRIMKREGLPFTWAEYFQLRRYRKKAKAAARLNQERAGLKLELDRLTVPGWKPAPPPPAPYQPTVETRRPSAPPRRQKMSEIMRGISSGGM